MKKELITYFDPKSPVSEMFRTLRTNLQYMNAVEELKTLAITSTLPGEGKSWTSSNLAVAYAQAGKKVVLIDADLRKGKQFTIFGIPPAPGLSNYLSGIIDKRKNINVDNIHGFMYETEVQNLFVMPAGNVPPNPAELLVSNRMMKLLEEFKRMFDVIIFDTPPTLLVTDACALSRIVDATIIVAAYGKTKNEDLVKVRKAIDNVGGKVAGVVMNQVPMSESKYEGAYYYGSASDKYKSRPRENSSISNSDRIKDEYRSTEKRSIFNEELDIPKEKKYSEEHIENNKNVYTQSNSHITNFENKPQKEIKKESVQTTNTNIEEAKKSADTNINNNSDSTITIDRTQDILKQVNAYLDSEKKKLNNGGY